MLPSVFLTEVHNYACALNIPICPTGTTMVSPGARAAYLGYYTVFGSCPGHPGKPTKAPQVGEVNKLEGVQGKAARFVCGEYRRGPGISVTALLKELQWPSLADCRQIARLTLFYNAHTGKISIPLCNLLDRSDSRTRGANK